MCIYIYIYIHVYIHGAQYFENKPRYTYELDMSHHTYVMSHIRMSHVTHGSVTSHN